MSRAVENPAKNAVAYHRELATNWEQRYQKPAFQARVRGLKECLGDRDICNQRWLDAGCGSGTLTRFLAEAGARVVGVDAAEDVIATAKTLASDRGHGEELRFEHIETIDRLPAAVQSLVAFSARAFWNTLRIRRPAWRNLPACCSRGGCWWSPCRIVDRWSAEARSGHTG